MAGNFWQSSHCKQWLLEVRIHFFRFEVQTGINWRILDHFTLASWITRLIKWSRSDIMQRGRELSKIDYSFCQFHSICWWAAQNSTTSHCYCHRYTNNLLLITLLWIWHNTCSALSNLVLVFFRRFYLKNSLSDCDPLLMAPTCLFLASKVEEIGPMSNNRLVNATSQVVKHKYRQVFSSLPTGDYQYRTKLVHNHFKISVFIYFSVIYWNVNFTYLNWWTVVLLFFILTDHFCSFFPTSISPKVMTLFRSQPGELSMTHTGTSITVRPLYLYRALDRI